MPVRVRLRRLPQQLKDFLEKMISNLIDAGTVYPSPTSPWTSDLLLVPDSAPEKSAFTIDLRHVNPYTVKY